MTPLRLGAVLCAAFLAACASSGPTPSHVGGNYQGKLADDTMVEASTTVIETTRDVVIAVDCRPLAAAVQSGDGAAIDRAVSAGKAAKLPAGVTLYTPPLESQSDRLAPFVVTDDKYGGTLCTPQSYKVLNS